MSEHHEDRDRVTEPGREMTEEEADFYSGDPGRRDASETEHVTEPERSPERAASYEASATAPSRAAEGRIEASRDDDRVRTDDPPAPAEAQAREEAGEPAGATAAPLFPPEEADSLRGRWDSIQTEFVDEPREAVEKADTLVGDVMQRLADGFSHERGRLEKEWDRGDRVSTEDLRVALKRYRSFFDRLLSV